MKNLICALLLFFAVFACSDKNVAISSFRDTNAEIKIQVCTRGCYQYLLNVDGTLYAINSLHQEFKVDGLPVKFTGRLTSKIIAINKPTPTDGQTFDFNANEIEIEKIVKR